MSPETPLAKAYSGGLSIPVVRKVAHVSAVVAIVDMIGSNVNRVGGDYYRCGEIDLLPPGGTLVDEGGRSQKIAATRPEITDMGPGVGARLIESDASDIAVHIRTELHA